MHDCYVKNTLQLNGDLPQMPITVKLLLLNYIVEGMKGRKYSIWELIQTEMKMHGKVSMACVLDC